MPNLPAQSILKYLAVVALGSSTNMADPGSSLLEVPADVLGEVVDGVDEGGWQTSDRRRVLELLAQDPRPAVRVRVARKAGALGDAAGTDAAQLLRVLARDDSLDVRAAAVAGLGRLLERLSPLDRIGVVAEWTMSDVVEERATIAAALRAQTPVFVTELAIEQLAADSSDTVRRFAVEAAARHLEEDRRAYARVLAQLAADPAGPVRSTALRVLERLERV